MKKRRYAAWSAEFDKKSPVPRYYQIENILERAIRTGKLKAHDQLPTEHELCDIFNVSRSVVRHALKGIEDKGLVRRSPGKGTFVADKKYSLSTLQGLKGFFQDVETSGSLPRSKVISKEIVLASGRIAEALQVSEDSRVIFINRLRFIDEIPFLISRTYLSLDVIPEEFFKEDFENQSLYALLEQKYGFEISYSQRVIEAVLAGKNEAELLTIKRGDSLIRTRTISYLSDRVPFEYDVGLHRGDQARFEINVFRNSDEKIKLLLNQER